MNKQHPPPPIIHTFTQTLTDIHTQTHSLGFHVVRSVIFRAGGVDPRVEPVSQHKQCLASLIKSHPPLLSSFPLPILLKRPQHVDGRRPGLSSCFGQSSQREVSVLGCERIPYLDMEQERILEEMVISALTL